MNSDEALQAYDSATIIGNLRHVRQRIAEAAMRGGRAAEDVQLMAVSKTVPAEIVRLVYAHGVRAFGENRVQEARAKAKELPLPLLRWEMIGTLQRNKVSAAVGVFARIQSVASLELAQEIDAVAARRDLIVPVLAQVNVAGEATKHGCAPDDALPLARAIAGLPHLRGAGLMTIAPYSANPEDVRPVFARLRTLRDAIRAELGASWQELSMGMSHDFPVAIEEGATLVRVGTAIFGARAQPQPQ